MGTELPDSWPAILSILMTGLWNITYLSIIGCLLALLQTREHRLLAILLTILMLMYCLSLPLWLVEETFQESKRFAGLRNSFSNWIVLVMAFAGIALIGAWNSRRLVLALGIAWTTIGAATGLSLLYKFGIVEIGVALSALLVVVGFAMGFIEHILLLLFFRKASS